ncbi:hypothetical protein [Arthrobacter sp. SO3]|uniref:hypothetical protein n=1 Tax=Arthrobacter sp. SO3 TaxID=1897057 RepID=UPI001CFF6716|nr:hypothetical protein [Arthrobacter sp. SO3]
MVPVTITGDPSAKTGWHAGRLPSRYDANGKNAPVEWKALDKRLSYWLSPTTDGRRWYRRPGDYYFDRNDPKDVDPELRDLLDTRFGTDLDSDRGDEINLGPQHVVGLDGIDLVRIHDGADNNGIAVIRFLLYIPSHMPDVIPEELENLRLVLRDLALYPTVPVRAGIGQFDGLSDFDIKSLLDDDFFAEEQESASERPIAHDGGTHQRISEPEGSHREPRAAEVDTDETNRETDWQLPSSRTVTSETTRTKVYGLYRALLEPVAHIAPDDGTLPPCKLMTQIILGDDFDDEDEQSQTEELGFDARIEQLMLLADLDGRVNSPVTKQVGGEDSYIHLSRDAATMAIGSSGLIVVHEGDGDFIRYRDVYLLSEMQGSLITAVDNGLFEAGTIDESSRSGELGRFLGADPVTSAFKQMHWSGVVSTDGTLQKVYDYAFDANRTAQRLASTRAELAEANDTVARGAEATMNWLLMIMAILAFAVPVGLTVAQFQHPWPDVWMVPTGLGIGALLACVFWIGFNRMLKRR